MSDPWFGTKLHPGELELVVEWARQLNLELFFEYPMQVVASLVTGEVRTVPITLAVFLPPGHPIRAESNCHHMDATDRDRVAEVLSYEQMVELKWLPARYVSEYGPGDLHFSQSSALPSAPVVGMR